MWRWIQNQSRGRCEVLSRLPLRIAIHFRHLAFLADPPDCSQERGAQSSRAGQEGGWTAPSGAALN